MDIVEVLTAVGANSLIIAVITFFQNRRINQATANATEQNSSAAYTQTVIDQANARVNQALADRDRAVKERDEAWAESKDQRDRKREFREKFLDEQKAHHATQLDLKDCESALKEERWYRCEDPRCSKRVPPRNEKAEGA